MSSALQSRFLVGLLGALLAGPLAGQEEAPPPSEETIRFFKANCASCHTIGGGRLTGPDLKDVLNRADRDWLAHFMQNPRQVIDSGDTYAQKLFQETRGVYMTDVPGLDGEMAAKLLSLIEAESAKEQSMFAGLAISDRPLTEADVEAGRELFHGRRQFNSGAPACYSCHTLAEAAGLGGGRLGPDLTAVYARMEGRKALGAWLFAPPGLTMQPVYERKPLEGEEILQLVAYLKHTSETGREEAVTASLDFLLAGFGAAAVLLAVFDFAWRNRFRTVRKRLVEEGK